MPFARAKAILGSAEGERTNPEGNHARWEGRPVIAGLALLEVQAPGQAAPGRGPPGEADPDAVADWITGTDLGVVNVTGPRKSGHSRVHGKAVAFLRAVFPLLG